MKKYLSIIILIGFMLLSTMIVYFIKDINLYSNVIISNWDIDLSKDYKEIYSFDKEPSFLGDGKRYHVFEYKTMNDIEFLLDWKSDKNKYIELNINNIIKTLEIEEEYVPNFDFEYKYYYKNDIDDNLSKIYIIFSPNLNRLYIIEDIY